MSETVLLLSDSTSGKPALSTGRRSHRPSLQDDRVRRLAETDSLPSQPHHLRSVSSNHYVEVGSTTQDQAVNGANGVCPHFHAAIELIGKRWTGAIVFALTEGPLRFGELARAVPGLSDRLLSQRLRELEEEGLVEREVEPGAPVHVSYCLTTKGAELRPAIQELKSWARRWKRTG